MHLGRVVHGLGVDAAAFLGTSLRCQTDLTAEHLFLQPKRRILHRQDTEALWEGPVRTKGTLARITERTGPWCDEGSESDVSVTED
jgi:hypothetical protein